MSTFDELSRRIDDADATMRAAEEQLRTFRALNVSLGDLTGRAESSDGHVAVEWSAAGLSALRIDPRAMRMSSTDLAETIRTTVDAAMADLREQTRALVADSNLGPRSAPTPEQVREQLAELRRSTVDGARRAADDLGRAEQVRRRGGWR